MNIIVPIKQVPETEIRPKIGSDGKSLDLSSVKMVVNPFDEFAIEEALTLRDGAGDGSVTVVTFGDDDSATALRTALAMGADKAVRIKAEDAPGSDVRAIGATLAAYIKNNECDLVLCGKLGVGGDNNSVPQIIAANLEVPVITSLTTLEIADGTAKGNRSIEGKTEVVEVKLPAVISCDKGLNEPRYPKLKGIMKAKKATIEEFAPADLGVDAAILGEDGASFELVNIELPPTKGAGTLIEVGEDPESAAKQLVDWLKNEAKVL